MEDNIVWKKPVEWKTDTFELKTTLNLKTTLDLPHSESVLRPYNVLNQKPKIFSVNPPLPYIEVAESLSVLECSGYPFISDN